MTFGRAHLKDQLDRATTSIVLDAAEGAGEFSPDERRRFSRIARRSATESAAIVHIMARGHVPADSAQQARDLLARIVSMLVRMTKDLYLPRALHTRHRRALLKQGWHESRVLTLSAPSSSSGRAYTRTWTGASVL